MKINLSSITICFAILFIGCGSSNSQEFPLPNEVYAFALFQDGQNLFPASGDGIYNKDSVKVFSENLEEIFLMVSSSITELDGYGFLSSELLIEGTYYIHLNDMETDTLFLSQDDKKRHLFNGKEVNERIVEFYILRK